MAITFVQSKKRQRHLILILALIIFAILLIVWFGFSKRDEPSSIIFPALSLKKIEIDWETLKSLELEEFQTFEEISPFEEETGREDPFISY